MKTKIALRCLVLLVFLCVSSSKANHIAGEELTYRSLGGNRYELTATYYRDCNGIPAPNTILIICSSSCDTNLYVTLSPFADADNIVPSCPTALNTCNGGSNLGMEIKIFKGTITLPVACSDWRFSTNACCRSAAETNIQNPVTDLFYGETFLDNTSYNHDSPYFNAIPVFSVCTGALSFINCSASAGCDSLVYSFIAARSNSTTEIIYEPGFSPQHPFGACPTNLDSTTGFLTVQPSNLLQCIYVVLVQQYRNGVLIGSIMRDVLLSSSACSNRQPQLTGVNGSASYSTSFSANQTSCFNIMSSDSDAVQGTTLTWRAGIPTGTFNTDSSFNQKGQFCWHPLSSDTGACPHCFTVNVYDNNCPIEGFRTYTYCITVVDSVLGIGNYGDRTINVSAFPNPFNEYTIIELKNETSFNKEFFLSDVLGRILMVKEFEQNKLVIERNNLSAGMYFFLITSNGKTSATGKLMVTD